jgi:hypothetical protein
MLCCFVHAVHWQRGLSSARSSSSCQVGIAVLCCCSYRYLWQPDTSMLSQLADQLKKCNLTSDYKNSLQPLTEVGDHWWWAASFILDFNYQWAAHFSQCRWPWCRVHVQQSPLSSIWSFPKLQI